jgi:CRISPR-associated endonuclease/helicase Cas3
MDFETFFGNAFASSGGKAAPYAFQQALAANPWPDVVDIPTGMGKTGAVTLAWLWKRGWRLGDRPVPVDPATPRRLVWCLPMRVLVEQTRDSIEGWLTRLGILGKAGEGKVSVHVLMGGEDDLASWAEHPDEDMILIGTQDMLLSRALMRGYGMSRYQWPIHFALLHNDCLWVYDEVQLMGAGLATSAQIEAFRRTAFPLTKNSRSLWVSATLRTAWLDTVDLRPHLDTLKRHTLGDADHAQASARLRAAKALRAAVTRLDKDNSKQNAKAYIDALCAEVLAQHDPAAQTLVILNNVGRAQQLFQSIKERRGSRDDLLIHARFRPAERSDLMRKLREGSDVDRIVVATQAIEAGVDISSNVMFTELAPWASLVQRFGRCNRDGKHNDEGARIFWIDLEADKILALPYATESLDAARAMLAGLISASPSDLPPTHEARPLTAVLRRKDFLDLFNTDSDLSGFDVDVSDYIRDSGTPGLQVFWRDFMDDPNTPDAQPQPARDELCPVSMGQIVAFAKRKDVTLWHWDTLGGQWVKLPHDRNIRPGMTLLARGQDGGYSPAVGFDGITKPSVPLSPVVAKGSNCRDYADDWRSQQPHAVALADHLAHVAAHAAQICDAVGEATHQTEVVRAGRWHDLGKLHEIFQQSMYRCRLPADPAQPLAKSNCTGPMRHSRAFFRHELASMLGWLAQHDGEPQADLIAYLILAHHGKVRMSLRAMPTEKAEPTVKRFARGIHEGDVLPALDFDGEHSAAATLKLALMEMGLGEQGASWGERVLRLLEQHGPFQLAWLETLVRLADRRASAAEQEGDAE